MNKLTAYLLLLLLAGCQPEPAALAAPAPPPPESRPILALTFDDGSTTDLLDYPFTDWNAMILDALTAEDLQATFFVTGANKRDDKGRYLLQSWSEAGHQIANPGFTHANFGAEITTAADLRRELGQTDAIISEYAGYTKLFRFPYLKEGDTPEKIAAYRAVLAEAGYRNGYVTIDASDWYINSELIANLREKGMDSPALGTYRRFYLAHILDRAAYYDDLAYELTGRHVPHTLLLHHNLTSALFLDDLIDTLRMEGWDLIDSHEAFADTLYTLVPSTERAGESLIWSLAKATGTYEDRLRYPAEDSRYEEEKLRALGL